MKNLLAEMHPPVFCWNCFNSYRSVFAYLSSRYGNINACCMKANYAFLKINTLHHQKMKWGTNEDRGKLMMQILCTL